MQSPGEDKQGEENILRDHILENKLYENGWS